MCNRVRILDHRQTGYFVLTDFNQCAIFNTGFPQYAII